MPGHTLPPDNIPASAAPIIISESSTHVVIAAEISRAMLVGYRRLFEQLIAADEQRSSPR
jgi:C4-dicarboxylate transporter